MEEFIINFASTFENPGEFSPQTDIRSLDEWSSLTAMLTLAMIQDEYGVTLDPEKLRIINTIQDLYDAVQAG